MGSLIALGLFALPAPTLACPMPPPPMEVAVNDSATLTPDGGLIVQTRRNFGGGGRAPGIVLTADGGATQVERIYLAHDLSIIRPKGPAKTLELESGKTHRKLPMGAFDPLPAPKLVKVRSTAARPSNKPQPVGPYGAPSSQVTIEVGSDTPADTYALIIYKLAPEGERSIAYGTPDPKQHTITYTTGGKMCYGGFETAYPGERIAVAWLDVHGRLSKRSATITVTK